MSFDNTSNEDNHQELSQEIFENYKEDLDFMDDQEKETTIEQQIKIQETLNSSSSSFEDLKIYKTNKTSQEPSY